MSNVGQPIPILIASLAMKYRLYKKFTSKIFYCKNIQIYISMLCQMNYLKSLVAWYNLFFLFGHIECIAMHLAKQHNDIIILFIIMCSLQLMPCSWMFVCMSVTTLTAAHLIYIHWKQGAIKLLVALTRCALYNCVDFVDYALFMHKLWKQLLIISDFIASWRTFNGQKRTAMASLNFKKARV